MDVLSFVRMSWLFNGFMLGIGLLLGVWCLLGFLDWLDAITSRLTPEEAAKRARQAAQQTPTPPPPTE